MNFGTQQIEDKIVSQLKQANAKLNCGYGKFAKDLAKRIYELMEGSTVDAQWNFVHNFPPELEAVVRKLERGLGLRNMKRDEGAIEIYKFMIEQEKTGCLISQFITWATEPERVKFVGKYRNSPEAIQLDYKQVFSRANTLGGEDERF